MNAEVPEVRRVLVALAHKLIATKRLTGRDAGMCLFGLKSMDSNQAEVRVVLGILLYKLKVSNPKFRVTDLSRAIVGILRTHPLMRADFLTTLAALTPGMTVLTPFSAGIVPPPGELQGD